MNQINICCAECGKEEGGIGLKACKSCKLVKYCNANCQRNHWATHKTECKRRAAELRDESLFNKDPPPKEDCPICFLPMPKKMICSISLPPATITSATVSSVPIGDFAIENEELAKLSTENYYSCCGKYICGGCFYSCAQSGSLICPFCNSDLDRGSTAGVSQMMKRVEANDAFAMFVLGNQYLQGDGGLSRDLAKAFELWTKAAELGSSHAHYQLGSSYKDEGDMKKAKFHWGAAAMAGNEWARYCLGRMEYNSWQERGKYGNLERAVKHLTIAASAGECHSMNILQIEFEKGHVSRDAINSIMTAYNNSCAEMRSEARDNYLRSINIDRIRGR